LIRNSKTGAYYANSIFRLSKPLDLLSYRPLSMLGRIRLGLLVFQAASVRNWRQLEGTTAAEWLSAACGREVFDKVWRPLLAGKFGAYADEVSAVWIWNKLALRGTSRGKDGREALAYFRGGFAALSELLKRSVVEAGGRILTNSIARSLAVEDGRVHAVETENETLSTDVVLATTPLPDYANLIRPHADRDYLDKLESIRFLGNVCLTLDLDRSLSDTYWLNVIDPSFPFVGLIEHTNFEAPESYSGRHIVYLSKYCPTDDPVYRMTDRELLDFAVSHIVRMFPKFDRQWVRAAHVHRSPYAQPVVTRHYSRIVPSNLTPVKGVWLATMAQIYPEDRGTNYAVRAGRAVAAEILDATSAESDP
jgi:protoporphyrinogen oxidase